MRCRPRPQGGSIRLVISVMLAWLVWPQLLIFKRKVLLFKHCYFCLNSVAKGMNLWLSFQTEAEERWVLGHLKGLAGVCSSIYFLSPSTRRPAQIGPAPTSAAAKVGTFATAQQMAVTAVPKCLLSEPGRDAEGQAEGSALTFLPS